MKLIDDRIVIEITYRNNEFGDPVADFESKDYAECVIEELEKVKKEILEENRCMWYSVDIKECIDKHISELKGE